MRLPAKGSPCRSRLRLVALAAGAITVVCTAVAALSGSATHRQPKAAPTLPAAENSVRLQVEHTWFHPIESVILEVERMDGRMIGKPGETISLDDRNSYVVQIDHAVTRLSSRNLSTLLNSYLLKQADSSVRHVDVSFDGQQVVLKGEVHKLVDLPFSGRGTISATPQGELRLHMEDFRVAGVLSKGFLELLGLHLDKVAQPRGAPAYRVEGDDFITPLSGLFPPPRVYGRITRVHVERGALVQVIGIDVQQHPIQTMPKALADPANYIYFTGGRMQFGKVTMQNVDLKLVNRTPQEAFDFSLPDYQQQIQAGYVKVTPSLGLVVYAENFSDLKHHPGSK